MNFSLVCYGFKLSEIKSLQKNESYTVMKKSTSETNEQLRIENSKVKLKYSGVSELSTFPLLQMAQTSAATSVVSTIMQ